MLYHLLNQISTVIPIQMLSETEGGIEVSYYENSLPSEEQSTQINNLLQSWPLYQLQLIKLDTLNTSWNHVLKSGWLSPEGYRLGIDIQDVALLNGAFTLAKEASLMGMNDPISIVDLDGTSHSLSLQDLTILMLQYGQARASLSNSYAAIKQSINAATTTEELDAIDTNI
jgi:hypothetical protein